jgi:hypothetical protein
VSGPLLVFEPGASWFRLGVIGQGLEQGQPPVLTGMGEIAASGALLSQVRDPGAASVQIQRLASRLGAPTGCRVISGTFDMEVLTEKPAGLLTDDRARQNLQQAIFQAGQVPEPPLDLCQLTGTVLLNPREQHRGCLLLTIGASMTRLEWWQHGRSLGSMIWHFGGLHLSEMLAREKNISLADAEVLKRRYLGLSASGQPLACRGVRTGQMSLVNWANRLASQIQMAVGGELSSQVPLVMTGGGARMRGLDDYLAFRLRRLVHLRAPEVPGVMHNRPDLADFAALVKSGIAKSALNMEYSDKTRAGSRSLSGIRKVFTRFL